jgi:hypothetical protein
LNKCLFLPTSVLLSLTTINKPLASALKEAVAIRLQRLVCTSQQPVNEVSLAHKATLCRITSPADRAGAPHARRRQHKRRHCCCCCCCCWCCYCCSSCLSVRDR